MRLGELIRDLPVLAIEGDPDGHVAEVRDDSRAVQPGDLFVAVPGLVTDGHRFLDEVCARGAAGVVYEREGPPASFRGARVRVESSARALATIASRRFGDPAAQLALVGVTGTNGKTTTTHLVESMLAAAGLRVGIVGTLGARWPGGGTDTGFTTPGPLALHALLRAMRDAGTTHVVMEASSHAIAQERLHGLGFRVGAFTNLTQDHLDFHGTMDAYLDAKARLVSELLGPDGAGVVCTDGPYGARMAARVVGRRVAVSVGPEGGDVHPRAARLGIDGIEATFATPAGEIAIRSPLVGRFNLENLAVAVGCAVALGVDPEAIARGAAALGGVPGRLERVTPPGIAPDAAARLPAVVVDYAHTPDALANVLATLRPLAAGRLLVVFGCGGDRDRGKRPLMGRAAARGADVVIVTSDNPRTEDPGAIVDAIVEGVRAEGLAVAAGGLAGAACTAAVEPDRARAIALAIEAATAGDVVLVAGKGHEDYQVVGRERLPFDDREVARKRLALAAAKLQSGGIV